MPLLACQVMSTTFSAWRDYVRQWKYENVMHRQVELQGTITCLQNTAIPLQQATLQASTEHARALAQTRDATRASLAHATALLNAALTLKQRNLRDSGRAPLTSQPSAGVEPAPTSSGGTTSAAGSSNTATARRTEASSGWRRTAGEAGQWAVATVMSAVCWERKQLVCAFGSSWRVWLVKACYFCCSCLPTGRVCNGCV